MFKGQVKLLVFVKMLSAQYLLTPLFESGQTCTVDGPREEMFPIDFQIKGQGQTADLYPKCCLLIILWSFDWWSPNFATLVDFIEEISLLLYGSQGQCQTTGLHLSIVTQYFMNHLLDNYQTWYSGCWIIHCIQPFWILHQGAFMFLKQFLFK